MTVVGVIVAAGESTRMGRPKQLLPIGGRPMLQWVVDAAEASRLDQVVVVTGHAAPDVRDRVALRRAIWAHNPHPERGTMSSLRIGVAAAGDHDAVMKLVCDQPEIRVDVIDGLIGSWDPLSSRAALARYRDGDGHPVLISRDELATLVDEEGDRLVWQFLSQNPAAVYRMAVDYDRPIDVNTLQDAQLVADHLG